MRRGTLASGGHSMRHSVCPFLPLLPFSPLPLPPDGSLYLEDDLDLETMIQEGVSQYARHDGTRVLPVFVITLTVSMDGIVGAIQGGAISPLLSLQS